MASLWSRGRQRRTRRPQFFRPQCEPLEGRVLLSTITWTGATGTDPHWSDSLNWNPQGVPGPGDDIMFPDGAAQKVPFNDLASNLVFNSITFSWTQGGYTLQCDDAGSLTTLGQTGGDNAVDLNSV